MTRQMKDSGVEWIGEIPEKWNAKKFKYIFSIIGGNGFPENLQGNCNGDYPFFKCSDINGTEREVLLAKNFVNSNIVDKYKFNIIPSDSILMAKIGEALKKNHRKINKKPCIVDNNMQALVFKSYECLMYYHYLSTILDMMWFDNGGTIPSVNNVKLKNFLLPNPPLSEQKAIADYLDAKCAKIDVFIAKQKTVVEKLKEYKQSVITEAVTKGLNPAVPMKSSGVEWIGDIPEDWNIERAKNIFQQSIERGNSDLTLLSATQDYGVYPKDRLEGVVQVKEDTDLSLFKTIHKNYFVISLRSFQGGFEMSDYEGVITPAYSVFYAKINVFHRFFKHLFKSDSFISKINSLTVGIREGKSIQYDDFSNLFIPYPPLSEQNEIADYLDAKCAKIDAFIAKKQTVIEKMTEYKKSLIYECVTGKREIV